MANHSAGQAHITQKHDNGNYLALKYSRREYRCVYIDTGKDRRKGNEKIRKDGDEFEMIVQSTR